LGLLVAPGAVVAFNAASGQNVTVPKGEVKAGTYYAAGQVVTIDGDVDGDLICAGSTVAVNGAVHGDVICAGQSVSVNGPVDGSVRLVGQSVSVGGKVGRNGTVMAQSFTLGSTGQVVGDLGVLGQVANVNGPVDRDVYGAMESLMLGSAVGSVQAQVNNLSLGSGGSVKGNLSYTSEQTFDVDRSKVGGEISRHAPATPRAQREDNAARAGMAMRLYWMAALLVVGLALTWLAPRLVGRAAQVMLERPGASIGWGLIVMLLGPLIVILLVVTVIGVPLGLLLAVLWCVLLAVGSVLAGIAIGRWFLQRAEWQKDSLLWATAFGVPLSVIIFSIPVLGALTSLVALWWAVGGVVLSARALQGDGLRGK
jgi:hypothetical protein